MPDDADTCGAETANGTPCQLPTTPDGDPNRCHLQAHGGDHQNGRPTKLDDDLIEQVSSKLEDPRNMVRGVLAEHEIPRSTWDLWLKKGKEDLGVGLQELQSRTGDPRDLDEPDTVYGRFLESLAHAYDQAIQRLNRMWVDSLVVRKEPLFQDGEFVTMQPVRLDPETGEKIKGEAVKTRDLRDYARARFSDIFAEKRRAEVEHSGSVTSEQRLTIPDESLSDPEVQASLESLAALAGHDEEDGEDGA